MNLFYLPYQIASAAENMARDRLLLEAFAEPLAARVRFYGWARPAWTFGYSQPWAAARAASGAEADLIRRPTGGGLVDHRADWTYALVFPAAHPLAQARACESYRAVHESLAEALRLDGCPVEMVDCKSAITNDTSATNPRGKIASDLSVCFRQPERFDLVRADDGRKMAGAAQKRTRAGLLMQGSINRAATPEVRDREKFGVNFINRLGEILAAHPTAWNEAPHPEKLLAETTAQFASTEWNRKR